jgi:hypothetical protein
VSDCPAIDETRSLDATDRYDSETPVKRGTPLHCWVSRTWYFAGGARGEFVITHTQVIRGEALPTAARLSVFQVDVHPAQPNSVHAFVLAGVVSNERYVTRPEKDALIAEQVAIGRPNARCGALIPIRKKAEWWALPQDERRKIFESDSRHTALGRKALPAVARRLHHCRDLLTPGPFDFLTWFDFELSAVGIFDDLLGALRETAEWQYVEREVELRVQRELS